jgi:hypothetical protein
MADDKMKNRDLKRKKKAVSMANRVPDEILRTISPQDNAAGTSRAKTRAVSKVEVTRVVRKAVRAENRAAAIASFP